MGKKQSPFPEELFVTQEIPERDDPFLVCLDPEVGVDGLDFNKNGQQVAIYKLVEVKTLDVSVKLK